MRHDGLGMDTLASIFPILSFLRDRRAADSSLTPHVDADNYHLLCGPRSALWQNSAGAIDKEFFATESSEEEFPTAGHPGPFP
jgi:hypothetical protein